MTRVHRPSSRPRIDAPRRARCCSSANAGSGKTSVLVERFVRAVLEDDIAPGADPRDHLHRQGRRRAARARAPRAASTSAGATRARGREAAWICTFHGFCARLLRAHALAAGLDPALRVLDERRARAARAEAFERALADFLADRDDAPRRDALDLAAAYGVDRAAAG